MIKFGSICKRDTAQALAEPSTEMNVQYERNKNNICIPKQNNDKSYKNENIYDDYSIYLNGRHKRLKYMCGFTNKANIKTKGFLL